MLIYQTLFKHIAVFRLYTSPLTDIAKCVFVCFGQISQENIDELIQL